MDPDHSFVIDVKLPNREEVENSITSKVQVRGGQGPLPATACLEGENKHLASNQAEAGRRLGCCVVAGRQAWRPPSWPLCATFVPVLHHLPTSPHAPHLVHLTSCASPHAPHLMRLTSCTSPHAPHFMYRRSSSACPALCKTQAERLGPGRGLQVWGGCSSRSSTAPADTRAHFLMGAWAAAGRQGIHSRRPAAAAAVVVAVAAVQAAVVVVAVAAVWGAGGGWRSLAWTTRWSASWPSESKAGGGEEARGRVCGSE